MTKRTLRQLVEKHEQDAAYCQAKADEYARRAVDHRVKAERIRKESQEAAQ